VQASIGIFVIPFSSIAQAPPGPIQVPTGRAVSPDEILTLTQSIGGFLLVIGSILAAISIILSGFLYMSAGSNTQRLTLAKNIFKYGVIGSLIIFSAGLIINVIKGLAMDPTGFFR
jgi:hypothetical protein